MNLEDGDPFERDHAPWIRANLSGGHRLLGYEKVWQGFIGNDGMSRPLDLIGLDPTTEELRRKFFEGHYSMAISAFLFDQVAIRMTGITGKRTTSAEYLRDIDNYASFISHLGHICDMVGRMDTALRANSKIHNHVVALHRLRSNAIHASRIPFQQDYIDLRIPIISRSKDPVAGEWHENTNWDSVDLSKNFIYLSVFADETRRELFAALNDAYPAIYWSAEALFKKKRVESPKWPPDPSPQSEPRYSASYHRSSGNAQV
jgi:hypothetical protein